MLALEPLRGEENGNVRADLYQGPSGLPKRHQHSLLHGGFFTAKAADVFVGHDAERSQTNSNSSCLTNCSSALVDQVYLHTVGWPHPSACTCMCLQQRALHQRDDHPKPLLSSGSQIPREHG